MTKKVLLLLTVIYTICFTAFADTRYTLTLSASYISLDPGKTQRVTCTVSPKNLTEHTFTWRSENTYIASVSENGMITAHAAGTTRIYCTIETGAVRSATVAVTGNPVRSLSINDNDIQLEPGNSAQLEYTIDKTADDQRVKWSSSDTSVATVNSTGLVTAVSGGTAIITLTAVNGLTSTASVYVPSEVKRIELQPTEIYVGKGAVVYLEAYVFPGNARNRELAWASNNEAVATVDQYGNVTGVSEGTCLVRASSVNGVYALTTVHVANLPTALAIEPSSVVLSKENRTSRVSVIYTPDSTAGSALTWESSDSSIVSVNNGVLTANNYGSATITATALNGVSTSCTVYVSDPPSYVSFESNNYSVPLNGAPVPVSIKFEPEGSHESGAVYSIDDTSVATVSTDGLISAVKPGNCRITVTMPSGITSNARVIVYENATSLYVKNDHLYMYAGTVQKIGVYTNSGNSYESALNASSDAQSVAFYSDGYVIAKSAGTALITLRSGTGNLSCSFAVTVSPVNYSDSKTVALTFDNGPSENTAAILSILNKYGIKATFFLLGKSIEKYPTGAYMLAETSHEIGNHTYSNISVNSAVAEVAAELEKTDILIQNTIGRKATLLRAPDARLADSLFGSFLDNRKYAARGIQANQFSNDTETVVNSILSNCFDTAVITIQDGGSNTISVLSELIPQLMMQGYSFVTVSELIELTGSKSSVFSTSR